jgi:hypothetical protein
MALTAQPGTTSRGRTELKVPDGGSTLALFGTSLLVISVLVRRQMSFKQA